VISSPAPSPHIRTQALCVPPAEMLTISPVDDGADPSALFLLLLSAVLKQVLILILCVRLLQDSFIVSQLVFLLVCWFAR
jgi:hypothetical protein